jgi:hypothetical protein
MPLALNFNTTQPVNPRGDVAFDPNDQAQQNLVGSIVASGLTMGGAPTSFASSLNDTASAHGLDLSNPSDASAAIWYTAQQDYSASTGNSLETSLQQNNFAAVQSGLAQDLPTATGSSGAPQGLASSLLSGIGTSIYNAINPMGAAADMVTGALGLTDNSDSTANTWGAAIENWLLRGGLIIVGVIVLAVALWLLLSDKGVVPSPSQTAAAVAAA